MQSPLSWEDERGRYDPDRGVDKPTKEANTEDAQVKEVRRTSIKRQGLDSPWNPDVFSVLPTPWCWTSSLIERTDFSCVNILIFGKLVWQLQEVQVKAEVKDDFDG